MTRADKIRIGLALALLAGSMALALYAIWHPDPQREAQLAK